MSWVYGAAVSNLLQTDNLDNRIYSHTIWENINALIFIWGCGGGEECLSHLWWYGTPDPVLRGPSVVPGIKLGLTAWTTNTLTSVLSLWLS